MAAADYRLMTEATGQRIAAALEALSLDVLTPSDVVNNLTSTATDKPGSANMLRTLNEAIQQATASGNSSINDYLSTIEQGGDATGTIFRFGKMRAITMRGISRSHTEDEVIMTLPASDAPAVQVYVTACIGVTNVVLRIRANGQVSLYTAGGGTPSGRLYFNASYVV